jgi:uncharacterized protein (UPF0248 family)
MQDIVLYNANFVFYTKETGIPYPRTVVVVGTAGQLIRVRMVEKSNKRGFVLYIIMSLTF